MTDAPTDALRDARPVLQLVHVSDAHLVAPGFDGWPGVRALGRWARHASPALTMALARATTPHDPFALRAFEHFLERVALTDPIWRRLPTWLVDTGDATTFGDEASLALSRATTRRFVDRAGASRGRIRVHGNHELWPDRVPLSRADVASSDRRASLAVHWPAPPLCERAAHGRLEVQLFGLDTTLPPDELRASLGRLASLVDEYAPPAGVFTLRLLASHHALVAHDAPPSMNLALAGHAHRLSPAPGELAASPRPRVLAIGSLAQRDPLRERGPWSQQCELLRVYAAPSRPSRVVVERLVAARAHGAGSWRFVAASAAGDPAEELVITLDAATDEPPRR